jgi:hypothetical protein
VLESVDYPVERTLNGFLATRYGPIASTRAALHPSANWRSGARPALKRLIGRDLLARSQVFRLARRVRFDDHHDLFGARAAGPLPWDSTVTDDGIETPFEQAERRLVTLTRERASEAPAAEAPDVDADLATVAALFGTDSRDQRTRAWLWLHLTELWDYLLPERQLERGRQAGEVRA